MSTRRTLRIAAGFVFGLALLGLLLRSVGLRRVLRRLATADPALVALGVAAGCGAVLVWSEALRVALGALGDGVAGGPRYRLAFLAGDFTKQVLPMGHVSGPAIMAYAVSTHLDEPYEETLAAVTVADLANLVASLLLAAVGLVLVTLAPGAPAPGLVGFAGALVLALLGVLALAVLVTVRRDALAWLVHGAARLARGTAGRLSRGLDARLAPEFVAARLEGYFGTLDVVARDRRRLLATAALALAGWLLVGGALYASALALEVRVPLALALALAPLAGLATWLPVPGGIGGVEVAVAVGLAAGGVGFDTATTVAVCYRLCSYWAVVALDGAGALALALWR